MRRRRVLALTAATVGFAGCSGNSDDIGVDPVDEIEDELDGQEQTPLESVDARQVAEAPIVGGSLNGFPRPLDGDFGLIEESDTTWLHAFLDVREKDAHDVDPRSDPDVEVLRRAAAETGINLVVSLLWDFKGKFGEKGKENVPPAGSAREEELLEYATELLEAIDSSVEIVVLGNEPKWETPKEDITGDDLPLVAFTRNLKDHLVRHYPGDPELLLGAFNKLYEEYVREEQFPTFHREFFGMARNDDDIDGIDLHVHYEDPAEAQEMLSVARREIPDGIVTTTEFGPVWRYDRYKDTPIGEFEAGRRFADRYDVDEDLTAVEYFGVAKDEPRPPEEMADFYEAMPWYNVDFVADMYEMMERYAVSISTVRFLLGSGARELDWTDPDWTPFSINAIIQRALIDSEYGAHPHFIDDYRERT